MNPTRFAHERPIALLMFWGALMLLGSLSLPRVPVGLMPDQSFPGISITVDYSGVGPEKIEQLITRPIEEVISTVGGIEQLNSTSEEGKATIEVQFSPDVDLDLRALEIRERVDIVASRFPRDAHKPIINRYDPDKRPVMIVVLDSDVYDLAQLRQIADRDIKRLFQGQPDVSDVQVAGGQDREILVAADKEKLERFGVSLTEVLARLRNHNVNSSIGRLRDNGGDVPLITRGRFRSLDQMRQLSMRSDTGHLYQLRDIAEVNFELRDQETASRFNGKDRVSIYVNKSSHADVLALSSDLAERLRGFPRQNWTYSIVYDLGQSIRRAFLALFIAASAGMLLAAFLLWRLSGSLYLPAFFLVLPVGAFLIDAFPIYLLGFEYDLVSVGGSIVANALTALILLAVHERGQSDSSRSIFVSLIIIGALFIPLLFSEPSLRALYAGMAIAVTLSVGTTYLLVVTLYPFLPDAPATVRMPKARFDLWIERSIEQLLSAGELLRSRLSERPERLALVFGGVLLLGVLSFSFARKEPLGALEDNSLQASVEFPSGTSFSGTDGVARQIEEKLASHPAIREITSRVDPARASLRIHLQDGYSADSELIEDFKQRIGRTAPAFVFFSGEGEVQSLKGVTVDVLGEDLAEMDRIVRDFVSQVQGIPGVAEVVLHYKPPRPERLLRVDRVKLDLAGISTETFGSTVRFAIQGGIASRFVGESREYDIRIRYNETFRGTLEALQAFTVKGNQDLFVPALELASMEDSEVPVKIYHLDKKRVLSFSLRLGDVDPDTVINQVTALAASYPLPENYQIVLGRDVELTLAGQRRLYAIALFSALLVFMILAGYFESVLVPTRVIALVLSPVAVVCTLLFVLRISVSVPVIIGLFVLSAYATLLTLLEAPETGTTKPFVIRARPLLAFRSALIVVPLFGPMLFVFGEGGTLFRSIGLVLVLGAPAVAACLCLFRGGPASAFEALKVLWRKGDEVLKARVAPAFQALAPRISRLESEIRRLWTRYGGS
ncbi:MAG: efflux RND transporter permease subunit [Spirochaetales bacterium]|nr:efflux RND transporter permease subunit [Leptospiraceae bacterium]MCP5483406.1 efflux RND transporter permease subunit [Spirochaetales bacterium]MCP5486767.1 efflux RND transporter permease subunit [Spirochaetales bacterium]